MKPCFFIVSTLLLLASCGKSSTGRYATVELRDGTSVSGTVVAISATEIQIAYDTNVTITNSMADVRSIDYDVDPPAAGTKPPVAPSPASPAVPRQPRHRQHYHPPETAITTKGSELSAGTSILVRNEETIDSDKAVEGQTFPAEITKDVLDPSGGVVIPGGSNAEIVIRSLSNGGRIRGAPDLVLDVPSISIDGRQYRLAPAEPPLQGARVIPANLRAGGFMGSSTIGAIIGAIIAGRDAAIGAGSGGAAELAQILIKGTIRVPVESVLIFQLAKPMRMSAAK